MINIVDKSKPYKYYIECFLEICDKLKRPIKYNELINNKWGLPSPFYYIGNCPDKNVKNYSQFLNYLNLKSHYNISKENAIKIIYNMQNKLNRPLKYDDFRYPKQNEIGIATIKQHWGTVNNMKKELGLEINQESMINKHKSIYELKKDIQKVCSIIKTNEDRNIISIKDIQSFDFTLNYGTYQKFFKQELGISLREYIESLGFKFIKNGSGMYYIFDDGEEIKSQYELLFSNFLRNKLNLKYNKDYFKDVRYKMFIKNYNGLKNIDYIIHFHSIMIYIEIAGLLRDYKDWYFNDKPIVSSKSKEKYRKNLKQKENLLIENNLNYLILFPSDLDNLEGIFNTQKSA